jgi:DNA-binding beta-propeller fold protein YncE
LAIGGCASDVPGLEPPAEEIRFPIGLALHPTDRYLFYVNSNFDLLYNGATVAVLDTTTGVVDPRHTVKIGSYAAELTLGRDGKRAFVVSRSDNSLNVLDVDITKDRFFTCTDDAPVAGKLPRCNGRFVMPVANNPFGIYVQKTGPIPQGCNAPPQTATETVFVASVNTNYIGLQTNGVFSVLTPPLTVADGGVVVESDQLPYQLQTTFTTPPGSNTIGRHPTTGTLYVTSRFTASTTLLRYEPGPPTTVEQVGSLVVTNQRAGLDSRGVAFSPDGTRAYIANRSTPSLLVFDVSCGPDGRERNELIQILDLGVDPGPVAYLQRADGSDRIYIPCAGSQEVYVIDPVLNILEKIIEVGDGPYDIVFTQGARDQKGLQRAYVADFKEDAISVIDLDKASINYHREIARLRNHPRLLP